MLASLFQGSKSGPTLESRTEEDHSRSLLWPSPIDFPHSLTLSPPNTPLSPLTSPTFRSGHNDDYGGLELNESKDVRIIVAQDAFGTMNNPMLLFDSHKQSRSANAGNNPPTSLTTPKSAIQSPQKNQPSLFNAQLRNRSTTISGAASVWSGPNRDSESNDKVNRLLECMFGVTSATKSESSTKMHVLLAGQEQPSVQTPANPSAFQKQLPTRAPLVRARTSTQMTIAQKTLRGSKDDVSVTEDIVLVTRMFTVTLPETREPLPNTPKSSADVVGSQDFPSPVNTAEVEETSTKKTKLIEKKVPMFAVAIMLQLPPDDSRRNMSRPASRTSLTSASFPNSLGSEFASSWTLLDAIPDSLGSSAYSQKGNDRRIEHVTNIWDVILRSLSHLEETSRVSIRGLLQEVNRQMMTSFIKTPKGPYEQRTNQRNIYLRTPFSFAETQELDVVARLTQKRISLALRIPKVVTGTGFVDGHWLDEARYLVHICGSKSQNFFLFNLMTAFLGNHTEWLEKIGFDWCKKQGHIHFRRTQNLTSVSSRTVIVAERRSLARRLIFLLASFLPSPQGINAFEVGSAPLKSPLATPGVSSSSPRYPSQSQTLAKNIGHRNNRAQHVSFGATDFVGLSTSASSTGSVASRASSRFPRPSMNRKDSDAGSFRDLTKIPSQSSIHMRKASTTNPATTPLPVTAMPFNATKRSSYAEEEAIDDDNENKAVPGLQNLLRRESSNFAPSSVGSTWGSILGGLWAKRHEGASGTVSTIEPNEVSGQLDRDSGASMSKAKFGGSKLRSMVHEVTGVDAPGRDSPVRTTSVYGRNVQNDESSPSGHQIDHPRLRVDEHDGVVDVDVGIPGFLSWEGDSGPMSPSKPRAASSSIRSLDGAASLRSSTSQSFHRGKSPRQDNPNVAGYLKRYHEDFSLQAVPYYEDLGAEIERSMSRESAFWNAIPIDSNNDQNRDGHGEWITVSSTLVADARKFSIERVTLQRRRIARPQSEHHLPPKPGQSQSSPGFEERFVFKPVMVFDETLTDAIEGILDISARAAGTPTTYNPQHARTPSNQAAALVSTPPLSAGYFESGDQARSRTDCRQVVAEALEEVVTSVNNDLTKTTSDRIIDTNVGQKTTSGSPTEHENVLREGVKRWLLNVDHVQQRQVW